MREDIKQIIAAQIFFWSAIFFIACAMNGLILLWLLLKLPYDTLIALPNLSLIFFFICFAITFCAFAGIGFIGYFIKLDFQWQKSRQVKINE